ncbi:MAG TPA: MgtC/SapB family protein [Kiloniellales bacterium]|nr:MgtC/SapB family protein [Kiloniellales bacterium]
MRELGLEPAALFELLRILLAFALAFPIAWERARGHRSVGFRTLPIVAMAACGFTLIGRSVADIGAEGEARVLQGIISGIGFVGAGAIVKQGTSVRGLVTAASIWNAGAIGAAVGFERAEIAVALSLINLISNLFLTRYDNQNQDEDEEEVEGKQRDPPDDTFSRK